MTFGSVYEITNTLSSQFKQRMVEDWGGKNKQLERWNFTNVTGSGGVGYANANGISFWTGSGGTDMVTMNFNDVCQYEPTGSVAIWIAQIQNTAQGGFGMGADKGNFSVDAIKSVKSTNGWIMLYSADSGESGVNTDMPYTVAETSSQGGSGRENWLTYKLEQRQPPNPTWNSFATTSEMSLDGVLKATKMTDQPRVRMQPMAYTRLASKTTSVRYVECYNT